MEIPEHLKPAILSEDIQVPVVDGGPPLSIQNFDKRKDLASIVQMAEITPDVLKALAKVGVEAEGIGVIKITTGSSMLTAQALTEAIAKICGIMADPNATDDKKLKAAYPLGYLANALTKVNSAAVDMQGGPQAPISATSGPLKKHRTFLPGQAVQMNGPVTINVASDDKNK